MQDAPRWMPWHTRLQKSLQAEPCALPPENELIRAWHNLVAQFKALVPRFPIASRDDPLALSWLEGYERVLELFPIHAPKITAVYGRHLPLFVLHGLCHDCGIDDTCLPAPRIERLSPDNPLILNPDSTLASWENASVEHFAAFKTYQDSLRPPKKRGPKKRSPERKPDTKRSIDPELAAKAYNLSMDGKKWQDIAKICLGENIPQDKRRREQLRQKISRLAFAGKKNALLAKKVGR